MREFKDKTLTAAGRSLIAKATVENKLEFVGAISSVNYMATPVLVNANISDFEGPTGSIAVASANGDVVRVVAEYPFAENDTIVKTVAITAKLHEQNDSEAVIIAAQSDPDVSVFIPAKAGIATSTQVSFNIFISDNGSGTVEIVLTKGVNLGDFEDLMKSTVTKHSIRNSSSGDDQTILGTKTFTNPISAESSVTILGSLTASGQSNFTGNVTTEGITYPFTYLCSGKDDAASDYTRAIAKRFKENSIEIAKYIEPIIPDDVLASKVRSKRDNLLNESDYFIQPDYPASEEDKSKVRKYRQYLRDVPSQKRISNKYSLARKTNLP